MEDEVIDDDENEYQLFVDSKMDDANFVQQVSSMDPAKREAYMRNLYRSYADESALATDELMMAKELRDREMPTGGMAGDDVTEEMVVGWVIADIGAQVEARLDEQAAAKAEARGTTAELMQQGASAVQNANITQQQQQNMISLEEQAAMKQRQIAEGLRSVSA